MKGKDTMLNQVEIEVQGPHNESMYFRPLLKSIRGRLDLMQVGEPMAKVKASEWPGPIPGQRLGVDAEGIGYHLEPLHQDEYLPFKEKIESRGQKLQDEMETYENIDTNSWLFWIKRAVEDGIAKVVKGKLPEIIEGEIRKNYVVSRPTHSTTERLANAIERQNELMAALVEKLTTKDKK